MSPVGRGQDWGEGCGARDAICGVCTYQIFLNLVDMLVCLPSSCPKHAHNTRHVLKLVE